MNAHGVSVGHARLSPAARELLGLLRRDGEADAAARALPSKTWDEILAIALRHGVAPLLHRALQSGGALLELPEQVRASLEEERRATALANLRNLGQFRRVARALGERDIPVMPLKGLHLAELVYRDISLRPMNDLDVMVPRSKAKSAVVALLDLDYGAETDLSGVSDTMLDTKCDIELRHRHMDVLLELHWSLSEPPGRYAAVLEDVWRGAVPARVGDADVRVMSPEFVLLHVCAHLACHHVFAFRLRALCDIAEIARAYPGLDWAAVIDQAGRHGWGRGVAAALRLASDHLGAAVPVETLSAVGADVLDSALLGEAMEHLVASGEMPQGLSHAANLMAFAGKPSLADKLAAFRARIFVSRAELALTYRVPETSVRLPLYHLVRLGELLRRYAASAWALKASDPALAAAAARHARLARWIDGS